MELINMEEEEEASSVAPQHAWRKEVLVTLLLTSYLPPATATCSSNTHVLTQVLARSTILVGIGRGGAPAISCAWREEHVE